MAGTAGAVAHARSVRATTAPPSSRANPRGRRRGTSSRLSEVTAAAVPATRRTSYPSTPHTRSTARSTFSRPLNALSRTYPSPAAPNPAPGVHTTRASRSS